LQYFSAALLLAIVLAFGFSMDARAETPERICNKAKMPEIDFYTCEGIRLRNKGQMLLRQAKIQISEGQRITADCKRLADKQAARDCNLLSSDMTEDAAFKQAEATELLDQAERMDARAADMDRKRR
jgi:hypothetical protein